MDVLDLCDFSAYSAPLRLKNAKASLRTAVIIAFLFLKTVGESILSNMQLKKKSLHILLTNHHLISYQGSENFTFTIADFLRRQGHQVSIYSVYIGKLKSDFEKIGVPVVADLKLLKNTDFDLAHVHHHINAYEVRHYFPALPIILLCHGVVFLENPPPLDLKISQYMATSERVRDTMIGLGVENNKIKIFRNMVDSEKFYPRFPINRTPQKALILSNKMDYNTENVIRQACKALHIKTKFVGARFKKMCYKNIPALLNEADIVFSLGRGVIEAMFCERIPIIFDYEGGDGMVTSSTIADMMTCNFSGNLSNEKYSPFALIDILKRYNPTDTPQLRHMALNHFSAALQIEKLIDIYYQQMNKKVEEMSSQDRRVLSSIVNSISETRSYSKYYYGINRHLPLFFQFIKSLVQKRTSL